MANIQIHKTSSALYVLWLLAYLIWGVSFTLIPFVAPGEAYVFALIGLPSLAIFVWMLFKTYRAEANEDNLILRNITTKTVVPWSEIATVSETIKFPVAQVTNLKISTKSGRNFKFPLDRPKSRAIGIPLESTTPMEEFIYRQI